MEPEDRPPKRRLVRPADAPTAYVAEEDIDVLDRGVCFFPLMPPIFQCEVGHVVCAPCRDSLAGSGKCHVCGVSTAVGGYRRCHAMERVVESVRVPCANAAHGCAAAPPYYDQHGHRLACAHAPCHCPDTAACGGFTGSTAALQRHFASGVHGWPCTKHRAGNGRNAGERFDVRLRDGFNVVVLDDDDAPDAGSANNQYLLLVTVARRPLVGRAISVLWIHGHAHAATKEMECELWYSSPLGRDGVSSNVKKHHQKSCFRVACTDFSDGMPTPDGCFQFVVPDCVVADKDKDAITVTAKIAAISRRLF